MDIFQLDWITISILVLIFLLILLISVRIYKAISRWRGFISNSHIESINLTHLKSEIPILKLFSSILLIKNRNFTSRNTPHIFFVGNYWFKKIYKVLIEAFCSNGYNVIFLNLFPDFIYNFKKGKDPLQINETLSKLSKFLNNKGLINNPYYIYIDYSNKNYYYQNLFDDPNNHLIIAINPKLSKSKLISFHNKSLENPQKKLYFIFNHFTYLFLKNKKLKIIEKIQPKIIHDKKNIISIEKSRYNFQYYETILYGHIIKIIKKNA